MTGIQQYVVALSVTPVLILDGQSQAIYGTSPTLGGEFLDGVANATTLLNFRPAHFAGTDLPLTFDTKTRRPALLEGVSIYDFALGVSAFARTSGKYVVGNGAPALPIPLSTPYDFLVCDGGYDVIVLTICTDD